MKKFDMIIVAGVIVIAAILYVSGIFSPKYDGKYAVIYTDDEEYARLPLDEDTIMRVETEYGYNEVAIKDGYADCTDADCRDGVCVKHKAISMKDETIVCLPHKVIIEIE